MTEPALDFSRYCWQGALVRLRPGRAEDALVDYAASLDSPSRQMLQIGLELPSSPEDRRISAERYANCRDVDGVIVFAIETLAGEYVGGISMHSRDEKNGTFGFGVQVFRAYRHRGYAADAARILLRYALYERRYQKCNSACIAENEGSIALHSALGFVQEGRRRRTVYMNGRYYDEIMWGMTREEFDAQEAARGS